MSSIDPRIDEAVRILDTGVQRQDSMADQLGDVLRLAVAAGCNDAHDYLLRLIADETMRKVRMS